MSSYSKFFLVVTTVGLCFGSIEARSNASGMQAASLKEAMTEGKVDLSFRYRFGYIDDDGFAEESKSSTLQTLLGYRTAPYHQMSGYLQFRNVSVLGNDLYNDTLNGHTNRPVEADPDATEVHQAYLQYDGIPDTKIIVGRRYMAYDNQRWIGTLAWRQNDRTFDGAFIETKALQDTEVKYGYVVNVNRGFTDRSVVGNFDGDTNAHLFNIGWTGLSLGKFSAYTYLLDLDGFSGAQNLSNATYGASFNGRYKLSDELDLLYRAEYARQTDYGNSPANYDLGYWHLTPGVSFSGITFKLGYEVFESDGTNAVKAPIGLLHAFGGWADKFLPAPPTGLEDLYASVAYKVSGTDTYLDGTKFVTAYHDYQSEQGSVNYGTEWNAAIIKKLNKEYKIALHYADYRADQLSNDTKKSWVTLGVAF